MGRARKCGLLAATAAVGLALWSGCTPTTPTPEADPTIEIFRGSKKIYTKNIAANVPFGAVPGGVLGSTSLENPREPVSIRLTGKPTAVVFKTTSGPNVTLMNQPILYSYVLDPDQQFLTLTENGVPVPGSCDVPFVPEVALDHAGFASVESVPAESGPPWRLPYGVEMYTGSSASTMSTIDLTPVTPFDYWLEGPSSQWCAPAFVGTPAGEIQALRLQYFGLCSKQQAIKPILETVGMQVSSLIQGYANFMGTGASVEVNYLDLASVIPTQFRRDLPTVTDGGGFVLQTSVTVHATGPLGITSTCTVSASIYYQFALADGFLTVLPTVKQTRYDPNPYEPTCIVGPLGLDALTHKLPDAILSYAKSQQVFPPPASCDGGAGKPEPGLCPSGFDCDPFTLNCNLSGFECTRTPGGSVATWCSGPIELLGAATTQGEGVLGIADPTHELSHTAKDPVNWECTPEDTAVTSCGKGQELCNGDDHGALCIDPTKGHCHFRVRAQRVVVDPGTVTPVFFDNINDRTQPGLALFAASFAPGFGWPPSSPYSAPYLQLCSTYLAPLPGAAYDVGNKVPAQFQYVTEPDTGPVTTPPPTPFTPRCLCQGAGCACRSDNDCPCGSTCMNPTAPGSNQNTVCSNICMQNSDCPIYSQQVLIGYGTCYTDIGRCATPPIEGGCGTGPVGTPLTCQNYEICEDRGNGPKCYERTPPNACAPPNGIP